MRSVSGLALARHAMMVLWQNNKHQPDNQPTQCAHRLGHVKWSHIFMLMERDIKESWHKTKQTIERPCKIIFDFDLLDSNDLCEPVARIRSRYEMTANCPDLFHFVEIPWREVSSGCHYCDQLFSHRQSSRETEVHQRIQRGSFRTYIGSPEDPCVQSSKSDEVSWKPGASIPLLHRGSFNCTLGTPSHWAPNIKTSLCHAHHTWFTDDGQKFLFSWGSVDCEGVSQSSSKECQH